MSSESSYSVYPVRCRTCYRLVDSKVKELYLALEGYPKITREILSRNMDDVGLKLYCCRRYVIAPEIAHMNMENRPVIEGVRQVSEAVAMEARQRLDGDFIFGFCERPMARFEQVPVAPVDATPASSVLPIPVSTIVPQGLNFATGGGLPSIPLPSIPAPALSGPAPSSSLATLQMGVNQLGGAASNIVLPLPQVAERPFVAPTAVGIPTYNAPINAKPVMVPVGARHHVEVISGVTFLAC